MKSKVCLALNICTYHRETFIRKNLALLRQSSFFDEQNVKYYGKLHIFIVDNASELQLQEDKYTHIIYNENSGGSGGFQRGIEEIRKSNIAFSHVIFMDDDVSFDINSFYLLFDFLLNVNEENRKRPVAGRMFCMDKPDIQYTAAEQWNGGNISHVEFMRDISQTGYTQGRVIYDADADYGGWWFCCFPMEFVQKNDVLPFFIHCDDVEYGLRYGRKPIIIEGVQVWHETYDKRLTPLMQYYDTRNPLFVNWIYGFLPDAEQIMKAWKQKITEYHVREDWITEYYVILAMNDFLKGMRWLKRIDSGKYHRKLQKAKSSRIKNAICWRMVSVKFWIWAHFYGIKCLNKKGIL